MQVSFHSHFVHSKRVIHNFCGLNLRSSVVTGVMWEIPSEEKDSRHIAPENMAAARPSTTTNPLAEIPPHLRLLGITDIPPTSFSTSSSSSSSTTSSRWHKFSTMQEPLLKQPRQKRFVAELALATGILGTFFGLFNSYEMEKIRSSMSRIEDIHNLLVQITKTQELKFRD